MAKLLENTAKEFMRKYGISVPRGEVSSTPEQARLLFRKQGFNGAVVKALVPIGRKGKAGAVKLVNNEEEVVEATSQLLKMEVYGYPVTRVYVEEKISIKEEYYLSLTFDRQRRSPVVMASLKGGVDIEQISQEEPEAIHIVEIDERIGVPIFEGIGLWEQMGLQGKVLLQAAQVTRNAWKMFKEMDLSLLEINPLARTVDDGLVALGAMVESDANADFRHPELSSYAEADLEYELAQATELERVVILTDRQINETGNIRLREMDGNIALLTGGAGAGLVINDLIRRYGGRPANYSDTGAGEKTRKLPILIKTILSKPNLRGLLVCYNILNLGRCDVVAHSLANVIKELNIDPRKFPIVVRLAGPGEEEAARVLKAIDGLHYYGDEITIEDAVRKIIQLTSASQDMRGLERNEHTN